jgi:hypothetical protein
VFPDEAKHLNASRTVVMKNGNSLFMLGVYHNLHCLVNNPLTFVQSSS